MSERFPGLLPRVKGGAVYFLILAAGVGAGIWVPYITVLFFALIAVLMCYELLHVMQLKRPELPLWLAPLGIVPLMSVFFLSRATDALVWSYLLLALMTILASIIHLIRTGPEGLSGATAAAAALFYVFGSFSVVGPLLLYVPRGLRWLLLALLAPAVCDVFAYIGGILFGKRRIVPRLSPKKTWGVTVAGTIGAVMLCLAAILTYLRPAELSFLKIMCLALVTGVCLSLFAQTGDWIASAVKRFTGVKDFSRIIPGHGGLFDRLDSFLTVLPVVFLLALWLERILA